ncbi:MAG: preprotein translocase subunit SecE [Bacteroidota bacterium]
MNKVKVYIQDAFDELLNKTSWPTWNELQSSAIIVAIASLIIAFVVYLMDASFGTILKQIYKLF